MKTITINGQTFDEATLDAHLRGELHRAAGSDAWDSLVLYITHGVPLGHFLTAVVENDLREACGRADENSERTLTTVVRFLYNVAPTGCWGSPAKVDAWYERRGLWGMLDAHHRESPACAPVEGGAA